MVVRLELGADGKIGSVIYKDWKSDGCRWHADERRSARPSERSQQRADQPHLDLAAGKAVGDAVEMTLELDPRLRRGRLW
jgi:hypothetical protein